MICPAAFPVVAAEMITFLVKGGGMFLTYASKNAALAFLFNRLYDNSGCCKGHRILGRIKANLKPQVQLHA